MKFLVTAYTVSVEGGLVSAPRVEVIDTDTNILFDGMTSPWAVEDQYHAFWNRLNESWETDFPRTDKVIVLSVVPA